MRSMIELLERILDLFKRAGFHERKRLVEESEEEDGVVKLQPYVDFRDEDLSNGQQ